MPDVKVRAPLVGAPDLVLYNDEAEVDVYARAPFVPGPDVVLYGAGPVADVFGEAGVEDRTATSAADQPAQMSTAAAALEVTSTITATSAPQTEAMGAGLMVAASSTTTAAVSEGNVETPPPPDRIVEQIVYATPRRRRPARDQTVSPIAASSSSESPSQNGVAACTTEARAIRETVQAMTEPKQEDDRTDRTSWRTAGRLSSRDAFLASRTADRGRKRDAWVASRAQRPR